MAEEFSGETTLDRLLRAELQRQFPNLSTEFINSHTEELMTAVTRKDARVESTASVELGQEQAPAEQLEEATALVSLSDRQKQLLEMLDYCRDAVLDGSIISMCMIGAHPDTTMEMVYSTPCNIYAWLGFMQAAVYKLSQQ